MTWRNGEQSPTEAAAGEKIRRIEEASGSLYEAASCGSDLRLSTEELRAILGTKLIGAHTPGAPKTRSKIAKQHVAEALGYGRPKSFKRSKPDFPAQDVEVGVQNEDNLQIWNEDPTEIPDDRRFVLMRLDGDDRVASVRVVEWAQAKHWDGTGTRTSKYQAARKDGRTGSALVSAQDTQEFLDAYAPIVLGEGDLSGMMSNEAPVLGSVLPIDHLFGRLMGLVGQRLPNARSDRVRGEHLQRLVCQVLGIGRYGNPPSWPDNVCQVLEIKLQTARTVDLGHVLPTSVERVPDLDGMIRYRDGRYLVAYADVESEETIRINEIVVTTGMDFFDEFQQFGGLTKNTKIQLKIPAGFFET